MKQNLIDKAKRILKEDKVKEEYNGKYFIWYDVAGVSIRYCVRSKKYVCFCTYHSLKDTEQIKSCSYKWALKLWRKKNG